MPQLNKVEAIIEGLLFAAGDKLPLAKLAQIIGLEEEEARRIIEKMAENYEVDATRGVFIRKIGESYQLCSKPCYHEYIKNLFDLTPRPGVTQAMLETVAVIAYNQPVTKAKIEHIRGVNPDNSIAKLIERGLIQEAGRQDSPGKPALYVTTDEFLKIFGLASLSDLPD